MRLSPTVSLLLALPLVAGCASTETSYMILGGSKAPQKPLVQTVVRAENETLEGRQSFKEAFLLFQRLSSPQAIDLDKMQKDFERAMERCSDCAEALDERIDSVREELDELVDDWSSELGSYSSDTLRAKSETMLKDNQARSQRVLQALERLQGRMQPVLAKLRDYALFFHHNLNPRAIATLEDTYRDFDSECRALEAEFDKAQTEIGTFLEHFTRPRVETPAQ